MGGESGDCSLVAVGAEVKGVPTRVATGNGFPMPSKSTV
jgi:hypothetical protein